MNGHFGTPGPGGSLGQCAICGKPFLKEILLGEAVQSFGVDGCDQTLYGHKGCLAKYTGKRFDVSELPEASPLRQAHERLNSSETPNSSQGT